MTLTLRSSSRFTLTGGMPPPDGEAEHQQAAFGGQHPDRVVEGIAADGIDDEVDAAAVGVVAHRLRPPVGQRQHHVGAERLDELDGTRSVHHRDHLGAQRLCDLDGCRTDTAGRPEHQHRLTRPAAPPRRTRAKYIV